MRQHLTAVKAAAEICDADVEGAELGSRALTFRPGKLRAGRLLVRDRHGGQLHAGVADGVAAAAHRGGGEPRAHQRRHAQQGLAAVRFPGAQLPAVARAAWARRCELELASYGFYPRGGGEIRARIAPAARLGALALARARRAGARLCRGVRRGICRRTSRSASSSSIGQQLALAARATPLRALPTDVGPGNAVTITLEHENVTEVFTGFGEKGVRAEDRGDRTPRWKRAPGSGVRARGRAPGRSAAAAHGARRRRSISRHRRHRAPAHQRRDHRTIHRAAGDDRVRRGRRRSFNLMGTFLISL